MLGERFEDFSHSVDCALWTMVKMPFESGKFADDNRCSTINFRKSTSGPVLAVLSVDLFVALCGIYPGHGYSQMKTSIGY